VPATAPPVAGRAPRADHLQRQWVKGHMVRPRCGHPHAPEEPDTAVRRSGDVVPDHGKGSLADMALGVDAGDNVILPPCARRRALSGGSFSSFASLK